MTLWPQRIHRQSFHCPLYLELLTQIIFPPPPDFASSFLFLSTNLQLNCPASPFWKSVFPVPWTFQKNPGAGFLFIEFLIWYFPFIWPSVWCLKVQGKASTCLITAFYVFAFGIRAWSLIISIAPVGPCVYPTSFPFILWSFWFRTVRQKYSSVKYFLQRATKTHPDDKIRCFPRSVLKCPKIEALAFIFMHIDGWWSALRHFNPLSLAPALLTKILLYFPLQTTSFFFLPEWPDPLS